MFVLFLITLYCAAGLLLAVDCYFKMVEAREDCTLDAVIKDLPATTRKWAFVLVPAAVFLIWPYALYRLFKE